jgi:hypothetical protein
MSFKGSRAAIVILQVVLLLAFLATVPAWGQSSNGSVRGTVEDTTKAVIPGAVVVLTNSATGVSSEVKTNEAGLFVFPAVVSGSYRISVTVEGMAPYSATLTVRVGESESLTVVLQPAATSTSITVVDATPVITTDNPTLGHTLERARIEQLPINGRQLTNLLQTVPGVDFDYNGALRTNGTRPGTHDFTLDGAALTDSLDGQGTVKRQPGLDTIAEFRVDMNAVSARNPRQTNVIMTTKGGTNQIHGSLFATNRDNGYGVARARQDATVSAKLIRNEAGGTAGGPLILPKLYHGRNRTFWFASYEALRLRQGSVFGMRVPTEAMRNGDFSGLRNAFGTPQRIYNPYETDPGTLLRPQFNYGGTPNRIDPSLESPFAKYVFGVVPLPNRPEVNPLAGNNYFGPRPDILNQWTMSARFDHQIDENNRIYARLTDSRSDENAVRSGVPSTDGGGNWRHDDFPNKSMAANWVRSISPTLFNEINVSASRTLGGITTGDPARMYATEFGLPNPASQKGYPVVAALGLGSSTANFLQPQSNRIRYFTFYILDDNATKVRGRHEFQFGAHLRKDFLNYLPQQQRTGGSVNAQRIATGLYDPELPSRSASVPNTGHAAASFYLGLADMQYRTVKGKYYMRQNEYAFYFQDNLKATPRLTLNLGVRYQMMPFPYDKYNVFTSWDAANQAIVLGQPLDYLYRAGAASPGLVDNLQNFGVKFETYQQAGLPRRLVYNNWQDVGPHLGFAYRAFDGKKSFVLRGGYSLNFFPVPLYSWNDNMRLNAPFTGFFENRYYASATSSPDGKPNYGLTHRPLWIAGLNTSEAIDLNSPSALEIGADAFQAAYFAAHQPTPRVHDWNLSIEKELISNTLLRLSYVGNHASHQDVVDAQNVTIPQLSWYTATGLDTPEGADASAVQRTAYRPGSPMGDIYQFLRAGYSNSTSLQVELERRFSHGFGGQFMYVMNNNAGVGGYGYNSLVNPANFYLPGSVAGDFGTRMRQLGYARDPGIPKHEFRWNWIADLPFGKGKRLLSNAGGWLNQLVGGWQVTGLGRLRSNYFQLPIDLWPTGNKLEYYGHKYPIQDCTSGECQAGWLLWNGYIPAHLINQPNGYLGIPANYKPAGQPLWPYPADYDSRSASTDPNYDFYGSNTVFVPLNNGTLARADATDGSVYHPWLNQSVLSTYVWSVDAAISKTFRIKERVGLRVQADFFNVTNTPGNDFIPGFAGWTSSPADFRSADSGAVSRQNSFNSPRVVQLSARFTW